MARPNSTLPAEPVMLYPGAKPTAPVPLAPAQNKDQPAKPSPIALATVLYITTPVNLTPLEMTSFGSTLHHSVCGVLHNSHVKLPHGSTPWAPLASVPLFMLSTTTLTLHQPEVSLPTASFRQKLASTSTASAVPQQPFCTVK
eukprot:jgi/Psemu1/283563/fgenesh1_pg.29_\